MTITCLIFSSGQASLCRVLSLCKDSLLSSRKIKESALLLNMFTKQSFQIYPISYTRARSGVDRRSAWMLSRSSSISRRLVTPRYARSNSLKKAKVLQSFHASWFLPLGTIIGEEMTGYHRRRLLLHLGAVDTKRSRVCMFTLYLKRIFNQKM